MKLGESSTSLSALSATTLSYFVNQKELLWELLIKSHVLFNQFIQKYYF